MKKLLCFAAAMIMIISFTSCAKHEKAPDEATSASVVYTEKGDGGTSYYLDIVFESGEKHYKIFTDEKTVGASLEQLGIIKGEQGEFGLYITSVEDEEHIYERDGKYWAFYENGEYALASVDLTEIKDGAVYALKVS